MAIARQFGGLIDDRELATAAWKYKMLDASTPELVRVCVLMLIPGMTLDEAKQRVVERRKPVQMSDDKSKVTVRIPGEEIEQVKGVVPGLSDSQLFRYAIARSVDNHDNALARAVMQHGGSRKRRENAA